jgi:hypothetical protein
MLFSSYFDDNAGGSLFSRYLAPIVPLTAIPAALALARFRFLGTVLAIFSIVAVSTATLIGIFPKYEPSLSPIQSALPTMFHSFKVHNALDLMGLSPELSRVACLLFLLTGCIYFVRSAARGANTVPSLVDGEWPRTREK